MSVADHESNCETVVKHTSGLSSVLRFVYVVGPLVFHRLLRGSSSFYCGDSTAILALAPRLELPQSFKKPCDRLHKSLSYSLDLSVSAWGLPTANTQNNTKTRLSLRYSQQANSDNGQNPTQNKYRGQKLGPKQFQH